MVLIAAILVIVIFQYLDYGAAALGGSRRPARSALDSPGILQLGVLTMLVEALALRDPGAARHATAVARYARDLATELGFDEAEQDVVHTAAYCMTSASSRSPTVSCTPSTSTDEDWAVIRRHPQDGATLVGRLDGYGPVAEAILYHHERVDGGGYPAGLIGNEIPLHSRIVAICTTYDTMTSRDTTERP